MNIIKFEIKNRLKFILYWTLAVVLISALFISFYPMLKNDIEAFSNVMKNYPVVIQKMFGFDSELLKSTLGYFSSFAFTFIMLFSGIVSAILGFSIILTDIQKKTAEFLYTKPKKRSEIIFLKITSGLILLIIFNAILIISDYVLLNMIGSIDMYKYILVILVIFFVQLSIYSISILISLFIKVKSDIAGGLALTFILYTLSIMLSNEVRFLVPFKYFNMLDVVMNSSYEIIYVLIPFILFLFSLFISIFMYDKKDL